MTQSTEHPACRRNFFCAKQATSVSLSIPVHFRRMRAPDYNSQAVLNLPFSKVNYSPDLLISVIVNMFHFTAKLNFNRFNKCRLTISETRLEGTSNDSELK